MNSILRPLLPLLCAALPICSGWAENGASTPPEPQTNQTPQASPVSANITDGDMGIPAAPIPGVWATYPTGGLTMIVATSSPEAQQRVLNGIACLLTFWDEAAYQEFSKAIDLDPSCMMAQWGQALSCISPNHEREAAKQEALQHIRLQLELGQLPSRELEYGRALVVLLKTGSPDAGKVFLDIAENWKRDPWAPLFAAMMLRDGFKPDGTPKSGQEQAQNMLQEYISAHPDTPAAWFLKALLQETKPTIDHEALQAAQKAAELLPNYPPFLHLIGHIQFRQGNYKAAEESFSQAAKAYETWQQAEKLIPADNEGLIRAKAYKAMARFCRGDEDGAIREAFLLASLPVDITRPRATGSLMQIWEARTLPLRLALSRYPWRGIKEIESITPKTLTLSPPSLSDGVIAACIQAALGKTALIKGDKTDLSFRLANLEKICTTLAQSGPKADEEGAVSYWVRGLELNDRIGLESKALLYPDSATIWLESDQEQQRFASLLMPPVLPYPAELRIAQWHARKRDWASCRDACQKGLQRFPNHAALLALLQQAGQTAAKPASAPSRSAKKTGKNKPASALKRTPEHSSK